MATSIGSLLLELRLDATTFNRDLNAAKRQAESVAKLFDQPIGPTIDHSGLRGLNQHLTLKQQHWKQVKQDFSKPLQVKYTVDFSQIDTLEKRLKNLKSGSTTVGVTVSSTGQTQNQRGLAEEIGKAVAQQSRVATPASSQVTGKIGFDDKAFAQQLEKSIAAGFKAANSKGIFGFLGSALTAPIKLAGSALKSTFVGAFENIGAELSSELATGISAGVNKGLSPIIGSFNLVGREIGNSIVEEFIKELGRNADKLKTFSEDLLGADKIATEFGATRAKQQREQRQKRVAAIEYFAEQYNTADKQALQRENDRLFKQRPQEILAVGEQLNEKKSKAVAKRGGDKLQAEIDEYTTSIESLLDRKSTLAEGDAEGRREIDGKIALLKRKLTSRKERLEFIEAEVNKQFAAEDRRLNELIDRTAIEQYNLNVRNLEVLGNDRVGLKANPKTLPSQIRQSRVRLNEIKERKTRVLSGGQADKNLLQDLDKMLANLLPEPARIEKLTKYLGDLRSEYDGLVSVLGKSTGTKRGEVQKIVDEVAEKIKKAEAELVKLQASPQLKLEAAKQEIAELTAKREVAKGDNEPPEKIQEIEKQLADAVSRKENIELTGGVDLYKASQIESLQQKRGEVRKKQQRRIALVREYNSQIEAEQRTLDGLLAQKDAVKADPALQKQFTAEVSKLVKALKQNEREIIQAVTNQDAEAFKQLKTMRAKLEAQYNNAVHAIEAVGGSVDEPIRDVESIFAEGKANTIENTYNNLVKSLKEIDQKLINAIADKNTDYEKQLRAFRDRLISQIQGKAGDLEQLGRNVPTEVDSIDQIERDALREQANRPFRAVLEEVARRSGVDVSAMPSFAIGNIPEGLGEASYVPEDNRVKVSRDLYAKAALGKLTKEDFKLLIHELRHAIQTEFGAKNISEASKQSGLLTPTPEELRYLAAPIERSASVHKDVANRNEARKLEADAYTFAERNTDDIVASVQRTNAANRLQNRIGMGGGILMGQTNTISSSVIQRLERIKNQSEVDITDEYNSILNLISEKFEELENTFQEMPDLDGLPVEEIEQVGDALVAKTEAIQKEILATINELNRVSANKPMEIRDQLRDLMPQLSRKKDLIPMAERMGVADAGKMNKRQLIEQLLYSGNLTEVQSSVHAITRAKAQRQLARQEQMQDLAYGAGQVVKTTGNALQGVRQGIGATTQAIAGNPVFKALAASTEDIRGQLARVGNGLALGLHEAGVSAMQLAGTLGETRLSIKNFAKHTLLPAGLAVGATHMLGPAGGFVADTATSAISTGMTAAGAGAELTSFIAPLLASIGGGELLRILLGNKMTKNTVLPATLAVGATHMLGPAGGVIADTATNIAGGAMSPMVHGAVGHMAAPVVEGISAAGSYIAPVLDPLIGAVNQTTAALNSLPFVDLPVGQLPTTAQIAGHLASGTAGAVDAVATGVTGVMAPTTAAIVGGKAIEATVSQKKKPGQAAALPAAKKQDVPLLPHAEAAIEEAYTRESKLREAYKQLQAEIKKRQPDKARIQQLGSEIADLATKAEEYITNLLANLTDDYKNEFGDQAATKLGGSKGRISSVRKKTERALMVNGVEVLPPIETPQQPLNIPNPTTIKQPAREPEYQTIEISADELYGVGEIIGNFKSALKAATTKASKAATTEIDAKLNALTQEIANSEAVSLAEVNANLEAIEKELIQMLGEDSRAVVEAVKNRKPLTQQQVIKAVGAAQNAVAEGSSQENLASVRNANRAMDELDRPMLNAQQRYQVISEGIDEGFEESQKRLNQTLEQYRDGTLEEQVKIPGLETAKQEFAEYVEAVQKGLQSIGITGFNLKEVADFFANTFPGALGFANNALKGVISNLGGFLKAGALLAGGLALLPFLLKLKDAALQAAISFEQMSVQFDSALGARGAEALQAVSDRALAMRTDLNAARESYLQFGAAVRDTPMEGITDLASQALSQAALTRGMTPDQLQRAQVAITQMVSKGGPIQSEEIRGQLAEALPGSTAIFARGLGMSQSEFSSQLVQGNIQGSDAVPKFLAQLQAETSTGVEASMGTTAAATQNLSNQIQRLMELLGKPLLPVFRVGVEAVGRSIEGMANLIQGTLEVFDELNKFFRGAGSEAADFARQTNKAFDDYISKVSEVGKAQEQSGFGGMLSKLAGASPQTAIMRNVAMMLPESVKNSDLNPINMIDQAMSRRSARQEQEAANKAVQASDRVLTGDGQNIGVYGLLNAAKSGQGDLATLSEYSKRLRSIQTERAALQPGDDKGRASLAEEERRIRQEQTTVETRVRGLSAQNAASIESLKRLRDEAERLGKVDIASQYNRQLEAATQAQNDLNKAISISVKSVAQLEAAFKRIQGTLQENSQQIDIAAANTRASISNNAALTTGQREFALLTQGQDELAQRIAANKQALAEQVALLNDPETQRVLGTFGFDNQSSPSAIRERADLATGDEKDRLNLAANQIDEVRGLQAESANLTAQMAEQQQQARQRLIDLSKEIASFYRQVGRDVQEMQRTVEGLNLEAEFTRTKTQIEAALGRFRNTFFDDLISGVTGLVDILQEISQIPLQAQGQIAGLRNQMQDNAMNASQLSQQMPAGMGTATGNAVAEIALGREGTEFRSGVAEQCANFVRDVFKQAGIDLGVTNNPVDGLSTGEGLANSFFGEDIGEIIRDPSKLLPGDIVGYANTYGNWDPGTITHVGVYAGNNEMIDRPTAARPVQRRALDTFDMTNFVAVRPHALAQQPAATMASQAGQTAAPTPMGESLFAGGSRSLAARIVGISEGTRTADGGYTKAYEGHADPGNNRQNQGSFSYQHGAWSGEDADQKWNKQLESVFSSFVDAARRAGLDPNNPELAFNFLDLYTQAPAAATGRGGFLDQLPSIAQGRSILDARVASYYNPDTGSLDAPGFGNSEARLREDQQRRMGAVSQGIQANNLQSSGNMSVNPANAGLINQGTTQFNNAASANIAAINNNAAAQIEAQIQRATNFLESQGQQLDLNMRDVDTSAIDAQRRAREAQFDSVRQTPDVQLERELFGLNNRLEDISRDLGIDKLERSLEALKELEEQYANLQVPPELQDETAAYLEQIREAIPEVEKSLESTRKAYDEESAALRETIKLKEEDFKISQERRRLEARQTTAQMRGEMGQAQIDMARRRQYDFGGQIGAAQMEYQMGVEQVQLGNAAKRANIEEQLRLAGTDEELTAELERQLELLSQMEQVSLQNLQDQFQQTAGAVQMSSLEMDRRVFDSGAAVLQEQSSGLRAMGLTTQADRLDKQVAVGQTGMDLQRTLAEINQMEQSMGLAAEQADLLRSNAMALSEVRLDNINNQFSAMGQLMPSIQGAFGGFFTSIITGSESIEDAFKNMLMNLANSLAQFGVNMLMNELFGGLMGMGGSPMGQMGMGGGAGSMGGGILGIASSLLGGLFGGGGGMAMGGMGSGIMGAASGVMGMFADGGVVGKASKTANSIEDAMRREGPKAELVVASRGELILPIDKTREFYARGLDRVLNFKEGGVVGGGRPAVAPAFKEGGNNNVSISISMGKDGQQQTDRRGAGKLATQIEGAVLEILTRERRPGGLLT